MTSQISPRMPPRQPFSLRDVVAAHRHTEDGGRHASPKREKVVRSDYRVVSLQTAVEWVYEQITHMCKADETLRQDVLDAGLGHPVSQEKVKAVIGYLLTEHRIAVNESTLIVPMDATESIFAETCGAGLLEDLYKRHDIEEIQVNGQDIFVVRGGVVQKHPRRFASLEQVRLLQDRLALCGKKPINEKNPVRQTYLHNRSRLVMTREPYSDVPSICIRNFIVRDVTLESLVGLGTISRQMEKLLQLLVRHHASIIVGGSTNTGKTTFLFALAREIPESERIITLEKEFEITLRDRLGNDRNVMALREVEEAGLPMEEAFKPILVMSPKWVVIGEAKGAEVSQMIQGSLRGHDIMGTMHTKYRDSFLSDVVDMVKQDGRSHDEKTLHSRVARAFNILVFLRLVQVDGAMRRLVTEVTELNVDDNERVTINPIVVWDYEAREWRFTGNRISRQLMEHMLTHEADPADFRDLGVLA